MNELFGIIYEDRELLVINKPAGLVCHPTKTDEYSSLIGRVRLYLDNDIRPHLVNRLDRETSGVVVVAKNPGVAGELGKILESRAVEKEYLAIVHGHVREDKGLIDAPLGKDIQSAVAIKDCVRSDGASAQTTFSVLHRFLRPSVINSPISEFSLLRVLPRSGRKHQIRIHLAYLGHPIVGDKLYGGDEDLYLAFVKGQLTLEQRAQLVFENHALHARAVHFDWREQPIEFCCEPELWFQEFANCSQLR